MDFTEVRPYGNAGHTWRDVAISLNGQIMVATITEDNAGLYLSVDGGANWICAIGTLVFGTMCMSDDGQVIFAGGQFSYLTIDGGANWTELSAIEALGTCYASDMTPDGGIIVAAVAASVYRSNNDGAAWTDLACPVSPSDGLSISADAQKMLGVGNFALYLSTDGGASWTEQMSPGTRFACCSISKNGKVMLAGQTLIVGTGGRLYMAKNGGAWAEIQPIDANQHRWNVVSASDAGMVLFAGLYLTAETRTLYSSIDYGETWVAERVIWPDYSDPEPTWNCITNRATARILCGTNGKRLWLSEILPLPPFVSSFPWVGRFQLSHVTA
jgi:photosystem II stability/assembly factor-like uncharacterized protein